MDEIYDFVKSIFPFPLIFAFPCILLFLPVTYSQVTHEFKIYRMQQYSFFEPIHGSRISTFNLEARSIKTWSSSRHCVITRLKDLSPQNFSDVSHRAGAMLVILPKEIYSLPMYDLIKLTGIEQAMLLEEVPIPIYFLNWDSKLQTIINDIESVPGFGGQGPDDTALNVLLNSIFVMGYQVAIYNIQQEQLIPKPQVTVLQGRLLAHENGDNTPVIVLVAHYDSFGVAPVLSFGADSNGSGVAALLELARLFSKLYDNRKTRPYYNLVFALTGGGKVNYFGAKKLIEHLRDSSTKSADEHKILLKNIAFVICLDTLASKKGLYAHVSKPPKEESNMAAFIKELNNTSNGQVEMIHKKINLAEKNLAWEHERFSIKKLPALTLSSVDSYKYWKRRSMFDVKELSDPKVLYDNVLTLADALVMFMYNYSGSDIFASHKVEYDSLLGWYEFLGMQPRSPQLLADKRNSLVTVLYNALTNYMHFCNRTNMLPDANEPEYVMYDYSTSAFIQIYGVKPGTFDLVLTILIILYVTGIYYFIKKFHIIYSLMADYKLKAKVN